MTVVEKRYGFGAPEKVMVGLGWESKTAWDYIQERDKKLLGEHIGNKDEQKKMCQAVFLSGGLPYMWDRAEDFKKLMYESLGLKKGDKILIIGEALEACGFLVEIKKRLQGEGEIVAFEMIDRGRGIDEKTGKRVESRGGPHRYKYEYADQFSDEYFNVIFLPQGVHHNTDWIQGAKEFARILKKGGRMVFAEATVGLMPQFRIAVQADAHIEAIMKKIFVAMGRDPKNWMEDPDQPTPKDITGWFSPYLKDIHSLVWSGMMLVYGTKK